MCGRVRRSGGRRTGITASNIVSNILKPAKATATSSTRFAIDLVVEPVEPRMSASLRLANVALDGAEGLALCLIDFRNEILNETFSKFPHE